MNWLTPIGFLGLIGLLVLIIIYIIKPNYQNKRISSTYIWAKSLRYVKRSLPISRLENIIVFLCQALILALLGTLLASPVAAVGERTDENETVIVVDASCGMRIADSSGTRFERAMAEAREHASRILELGSAVTVIIADDTPDYLFLRILEEGAREALESMDALIAEGADACSFRDADMSGAMTLAESVCSYNPSAEVYLYTGTDYVYDNGVNVVNVSGDGEWNAAVLGCTAELDNDNHYKVTVSVGCYGRTDFVTVYCRIHGVNGDPSNTVLLEKGEFFDPSDEEKEIVFSSDDMTSGVVYSYDYVEAYVSVRDSLSADNSFFLYGGKKRVVKVQYASSSPNNFFESAVRTLRESNKDTWDVQFTLLGESEACATEGYDIYIFEHRMPEVLPTDGVVLLVDPDIAPAGSGLQIGAAYSVDSSSTLAPGRSHELTKYTSAGRITIAKYNDVILAEGYEELMFYNGRPVMLAKDTEDARVVVWAFDLNYSNVIALPDFSILIYNLFNCFITETFEGSCFEVGDSVELHGDGSELCVRGGDEEIVFENGEGTLVPTRPGTYTVTRGELGSGQLEESFFVKIASGQSDTSRTEDVLPFTAADAPDNTEYTDLVLLFATALVVLMFADWCIEIKRNYR